MQPVVCPCRQGVPASDEQEEEEARLLHQSLFLASPVFERAATMCDSDVQRFIFSVHKVSKYIQLLHHALKKNKQTNKKPPQT